MPHAKTLRRPVSIVLTMMFIVPIFMGLTPVGKVSAGTAKITSFDGDVPTKTLDFTNQKINDTLSFKVPKAAKITGASMDIQGLKVEQPGHISLASQDEYMNANPRDLNLNKTPDKASIIERQNLSDTFNDGALDTTNWSWMNPPFAVNENLGTGMLEITSVSHTNWSGVTQTGNFLYKNVDGNFMVIAKMSCNPDSNQNTCGLMVYGDTDNWFQEVFKWRKYGNNGGQMMDFKKRQGGVTSPDSNIGFAANPMFIKITRHEDQWKVYYSNNAVVFNWHLTFNWSLPSTVRVGPIVYDGLEANENFRADFDAVNITRYKDFGNMSVGPINTPFPVSKVHMNQDLEQLEIWETFQVFVRTNASGAWQLLVGDTDTLIATPGKQLEMRVSIGGQGWTTPVLRWVTLDYYPESWPSLITLDVGNDGSIEWWYNQTLNGKATVGTPSFLSSLEAKRSDGTADAEGYVHIPMRVTDQLPGKVTFSNLGINLFTGYPPKAPTLGLPANNTWIGTRTPTFNFSSVDPESETVTYKILISENNFQNLTYEFSQKTDLFGWSMSLYDSGQEARFTMDASKPLEHAKTYQWKVAAYDGGWWSNFSAIRTIKVDVSIPTGTVADAGATTPVNREAFATIDFKDLESGIEYIECGLGTQKNKTDIVQMTPVDITTGKVHFTNLTLEDKKSYFFTAHARNVAGLWSMNMTSDGLRIDLSLDQPPRVNVTNPVNKTMVDGLVTVSGTASDANAGDKIIVYVAIDDNPWVVALGSTIWSYEWDSKKVADGEHRIYVKAFDGMRDSETVTLRVVVGNNQMSFSSWTPTTDPTITEADSIELLVVLRDPAKIFKSYTWAIDGVNVPNLNQANFTFKSTYDDAGMKVIEVKAMGVSMSTSHKWNVTVLNLNRDPKSSISLPKDRTKITVGKTLSFDGTSSSDPDSETLTYLWNLGDKTTSTTSRFDHKYSKEGTYTVKLTVTDKWNASSDSQITVKVEAKKVDIAAQMLTFPMVLIPLFLIIGITGLVLFYIAHKFKQQKEFDKKIETKIDDSTIDDLLYYNPAPQQPGTVGQTQQPVDQGQQPPAQYPPDGGQAQPPQQTYEQPPAQPPAGQQPQQPGQ